MAQLVKAMPVPYQRLCLSGGQGYASVASEAMPS